MSASDTKTITPDPKPARKPRQTKAQKDAQAVAKRAEAKAIALREGKDAQKAMDAEELDAAQAELDAEPSNVNPDADQDANMVGEAEGDEPSAQVDVKAKVRAASAATLARRAKNEADKAKTKERKAEERELRESAGAAFKQSVVDSYAQTSDVKATAAAFLNPKTGEPYSQMRIRRILNEAGVLVATKRGDTSERDARIVGQIEGGVEIADIATEHGLSAQRVRGIAKKAGLTVDGGRSGKLPEAGTPEWDAFKADVAAITEKWGVALGTMAHAIRKA